MAEKKSFFSFFRRNKNKEEVKKEEEKKIDIKPNAPASSYSLPEDIDLEEVTFKEMSDEISDELEDYDEFYFDEEFDMNSIPLFDTEGFRSIFMSLRKQIDDLYESKNSTTEEHEALRELFTNIKTSAYTDIVAQDFLGYCYKRGAYSFVPMNYENYMDITLLAAAQGNPFSIQRLQLFLSTTITDFFEEPGHAEIMDELNVTDENYSIFLAKIICGNMVKLSNISIRQILSRNTYQQQTDVLTRKYERLRDEALKLSIQELTESAQKLVDFYTVLISNVEKAEEEKENAETETEVQEETTSSTWNSEVLPTNEDEDIKPTVEETVEEEQPVEEEKPHVLETMKTQIAKEEKAKKTTTVKKTTTTKKTTTGTTKKTTNSSTTKKKASTPKGSDELQ